MAFDWKEFLVLARFLQTQAQEGGPISQEAAYRCAVGRAYFAAYCHAYQYACTWLGFQPRTKPEEKSQDHGRLKTLLKSKRAHVAKKLDDLRQWRNECDYEEDIRFGNLPEQVVYALQAADYVFSSLKPPAPLTPQ